MGGESCDAVVVGGGLVGLFAAWHLARRGRRVLVAERERIACGTTGASFAWLNATSKTEPAYHRLNAEGLARHLELARLWGEPATGLHGAGVLTWSEPDSAISLAALRDDHAALAALDYPVLRLGRRELVALEPHVAFGEGAEGMMAPRDRWLDAPVLARRLAVEIERAGGTVREGAPVEAIARGCVTVDGEAIACDTVVIAAGPATAEAAALAGVPDVPVGRVPGLLVTLPPDNGRRWVNHIVYAPDAGNFHIRPTADGGLLLGDDEVDRLVADTPDGGAVARATRALLEVAGRHLPGLDSSPSVAGARAAIGVRPMPSDGRTIAGPLPGAEGIWVIATHSGITLAPLLGELIAAEIVEGTVSPLLASFRPDRFSS